jgi:hypothetical protein
MKDEEQRRIGFTSSKRSSPQRNEFDLIHSVRQRADTVLPPAKQHLHHASLLQGIGDDGAVIKQQSGRETVITTDLLVEDIDFRRDSTPAALLGHKALAVSLSDPLVSPCPGNSPGFVGKRICRSVLPGLL